MISAHSSGRGNDVANTAMQCGILPQDAISDLLGKCLKWSSDLDRLYNKSIVPLWVKDIFRCCMAIPVYLASAEGLGRFGFYRLP